MKRFLKNSIAISLLTLLFATSCIQSDYTFGNDMLDGGVKMETSVDTFYLTKTYQCVADSFPTGSSSTAYMGKWHSDSTGTCRAGIVTNYFPWGFEDYTFFGSGAAVDSMKLTMGLSFLEGMGDSTISMRINIYRLNGITLKADSTYYTNFPIEKYIDPTPIATARTREYSADTAMTINLPKWFADLHFDNRSDTSNIYARDDKFIHQINGLYFEAEPVNPSDRGLLSLNMTGSVLRLYYHNSVYPDSLLTQTYYFYNTSYSSLTSNFITIRNDFTTAKPNIGGVDYRIINDTLEPQKRLYIACPNELYTRIDFDTTILNSLKRKADEKGYKYVGIQNAELRIKMPNADYKTMDNSISTLKLYLDIDHPKFLSEYNPLYTTSSDYNTINGALVRSLGYYSLNITGYVQRLLNKAASQQHLEIFPVYSAGMSWGDTYIGGSEDEQYKPELIVTYTFIEKK